MANWYYVNKEEEEVDIERVGLDLTAEPRKAYVSVILSYKDIEKLYNQIREDK